MIKTCPISGFLIESDANWLFVSKIDKDYSVKISFIDSNIVLLDVVGFTSDGNRLEIWPKISNLITSRLGDSKYYLVHNYQNFIGGDSKARNHYINWINENISIISANYFYNCSPLTKIQIKAGKLFSKKLKNTFIFDTYEQVIDDIKNRRVYPKTSDITQDYSPIRTWSHKYESSEYRSETYLYENNLIIRKFFGALGDNSMADFIISLRKISDQMGFHNKHLYYYFDFEEVESMSLKFRRDSYEWFNSNKDNIISGGVFNVTPMLEAQVKIARSLSPFSYLRKKVHVYDNIDQVFENILEPSKDLLSKNTSREKNYNALSKGELIEELEHLHSKINNIENERDNQLQEIYAKIGRVSWDENFEFKEENIDESNSPYSEVNNAIILIQKDMKEIIAKRDKLLLKAQESDTLKSEFLANMSHEIRTPMNSVIGFTNILLEETDDDRQLKFLNLVNNSANHLLSLINDILDISKIQSGNIKLEVEHCELNPIINSIIEEQRLHQLDKPVDIRFNPEENISIDCDRTRFKQILINLISNAVKYTLEGEINISYIIKKDRINISVLDTGKGISVESQKHIFKRFRQVDNSITRKHDGAGLGLAITKSLVELHKGEIWLESEENLGSIFTISLPYKAKTPSKVNQSIPKNHLSVNNKKILITEDNDDNFFYLEVLLDSNKNQIIRADNGLKAIELLKNEEFDIIFMDIQMPYMDGITCIKEIRKFNYNTPIIAQTAYAMNENKTEALNAGCNYYLSKPIKKNELHKVLKELL